MNICLYVPARSIHEEGEPAPLLRICVSARIPNSHHDTSEHGKARCHRSHGLEAPRGLQLLDLALVHLKPLPQIEELVAPPFALLEAVEVGRQVLLRLAARLRGRQRRDAADGHALAVCVLLPALPGPTAAAVSYPDPQE